jgi:hypothetical protein
MAKRIPKYEYLPGKYGMFKINLIHRLSLSYKKLP